MAMPTTRMAGPRLACDTNHPTLPYGGPACPFRQLLLPARPRPTGEDRGMRVATVTLGETSTASAALASWQDWLYVAAGTVPRLARSGDQPGVGRDRLAPQPARGPGSYVRPDPPAGREDRRAPCRLHRRRGGGAGLDRQRPPSQRPVLARQDVRPARTAGRDELDRPALCTHRGSSSWPGPEPTAGSTWRAWGRS